MFQEFVIQYSITAAYHPESNRLVEQVIRTVKWALRQTKMNKNTIWTWALHIAVSAYRMVPHRVTGQLPFKMLYGREAVTAEELKYTRYKMDKDYEEAVKKHVRQMLI